MHVMRRYLTEDEQRRLLAAVNRVAGVLAGRDSAWMRLLLHSGMRVGELAAMRIDDARQALESGYIFIPRERRKGRRNDHQVLVTEPLKQALRDLLRAAAEMRGVEQQGLPADAPLVASRKHCAMTIRAYQQRIAYWRATAGVAGASPHWFRHTRAMNIMRRSTSNDPRGIVQVALGHASISSTGVYTRPSKEDVERELRIVDGQRRVPRKALRAEYERRVGA